MNALASPLDSPRGAMLRSDIVEEPPAIIIPIHSLTRPGRESCQFLHPQASLEYRVPKVLSVEYSAVLRQKVMEGGKLLLTMLKFRSSWTLSNAKISRLVSHNTVELS